MRYRDKVKRFLELWDGAPTDDDRPWAYREAVRALRAEVTADDAQRAELQCLCESAGGGKMVTLPAGLDHWRSWTDHERLRRRQRCYERLVAAAITGRGDLAGKLPSAAKDELWRLAGEVVERGEVKAEVERPVQSEACGIEADVLAGAVG